MSRPQRAIPADRPRPRPRAAGAWRLLLLATGLVGLAACASPGDAAASPTTTAPGGHGQVDVLYAGSLAGLMEHSLGPAFTKATGYQFTGFAAGSDELASEIKGGIRTGDVFISASPAVDESLMGAANGDHVRWHLTFGHSALVLGYDPQSSFAGALAHRPWWEVVTAPGFRLGRTDPDLDPKGALAVSAVQETARVEHDPVLLHALAGTQGVFPEETLVGRLQTGQLDAGFFYRVEAHAAGIPTVSLAPAHLEATYTVTVLDGAPDRAGALSFVRYLLGPEGRHELVAAGLQPETPPMLTGRDLPAGLPSAPPSG